MSLEYVQSTAPQTLVTQTLVAINAVGLTVSLVFADSLRAHPRTQSRQERAPRVVHQQGVE